MSYKSRFVRTGNWVWLPHETETWIPVELCGTTGDGFVVALSETGQEFSVKEAEAGKLSKVHSSALRGIPNMIHLEDMTEGVILHTLRARYKKDRIYTFISSIMVSINPYKQLPIYGLDKMRAIRDRSLPTVSGTPSSSTASTRAPSIPSPRNRDTAASSTTVASASASSSESVPDPESTDILSSPHLYALAQSARTNLTNTGKNQSVLVSGESGSGKTEATKIILEYLSFVSTSSAATPQPASAASTHGKPSVVDGESEYKQEGSGGYGKNSRRTTATGVAQQILEANPLIEAFGNARTVRNDNSSRFGKWIEIHFDSQHRITGGLISHYLLEKSRVVNQALGERNYHIFYQVCSPLSAPRGQPAVVDVGANGQPVKPPVTPYEILSKFGLQSADNYAYLNGGRMMSIDGVSDETQLQRTFFALNCLNFSAEDVDVLMSIVVAILQLGQIAIIPKGKNNEESQVDLKDVALNQTARLLGVEVAALEGCICTWIKAFSKRSLIRVPFNVGQAVSGRDALAKHLYSNMFDWMISKVNQCLQTNKYVFGVIGVLDIFGFEIFEVNRLEQFLINFANEKLQRHFNHCVFELEQEEYKAEELDVRYVAFSDNSGCLQLIENSPGGVLAMLDEELRLPKGGDDNLLIRLHQSLGGNPYYKQPRVNEPTFSIKHYAGVVVYQVDGFVEKNKDKLSDGVATLLSSSSRPVVAKLFTPSATVSDEKTPNSARGKAASIFGSSAKSPTAQPALASPTSASLDKTLGSLFKRQLTSLMTKLESTTPHFIKCLKPNSVMQADNFDSQLVLRQLRYAGIEAVIRIRQQGFPVRHTHKDFYLRFKGLAPQLIPTPNATTMAFGAEEMSDAECSKMCRAIMEALKVAAADYGMGRTKIFLTHERHVALERARDLTFARTAVKLQSWRRGKRARRIFAKLQACVRTLGALARRKEELSITKRLQPDFVSAVQSAIEASVLTGVPAHIAQLTVLQAVKATLAKQEASRASMSKLVDSKSDDIILFDQAMTYALTLGEEMSHLPEFSQCKIAKEEIIERREKERIERERELLEQQQRELQAKMAREEEEQRRKQDQPQPAPRQSQQQVQQQAALEKHLQQEKEEMEKLQAKIKELEQEKLRVQEMSQKLEQEKQKQEKDADGKRRNRRRHRNHSPENDNPKDNNSTPANGTSNNTSNPNAQDKTQRSRHRRKYSSEYSDSYSSSGSGSDGSRRRHRKHRHKRKELEEDRLFGKRRYSDKHPTLDDELLTRELNDIDVENIDTPYHGRRHHWNSGISDVATRGYFLNNPSKTDSDGKDSHDNKDGQPSKPNEASLAKDLIQKLRKKILALEHDNQDMADLYRRMNASLFAKLAEYEKYKERVSNMESKYLERIQEINLKMAILDRIVRDKLTEEEYSAITLNDPNDPKANPYAQRLMELERQNDMNQKDLMSKCDQVLRLKIQMEDIRASGEESNMLLQAAQAALDTQQQEIQDLQIKNKLLLDVEEQNQKIQKSNLTAHLRDKDALIRDKDFNVRQLEAQVASLTKENAILKTRLQRGDRPPRRGVLDDADDSDEVELSATLPNQWLGSPPANAAPQILSPTSNSSSATSIAATSADAQRIPKLSGLTSPSAANLRRDESKDSVTPASPTPLSKTQSGSSATVPGSPNPLSKTPSTSSNSSNTSSAPSVGSTPKDAKKVSRGFSWRGKPG